MNINQEPWGKPTKYVAMIQEKNTFKNSMQTHLNFLGRPRGLNPQ
jgi:hypothetical protein